MGDGRRSSPLPEPASARGRLSEVARVYMEEVRAEVAEVHWAGTSGGRTAARLATCLDDLMRLIFDVATERFTSRYARTRQQCAILAVGGYGRCEQSPHSDIDFLVLHSGRVTPYVETINESFVYTLWDAKLDLGHAVRNEEECLRLAERDITVRTAIMDGRFLCGSEELAERFAEKVKGPLTTKDAKAFVEAVRADTVDRHERNGGSVFMLEPNVKEGKGGQRDLHAALWLARACKGIADLHGLLENDFISETECEELVAAHEFMLRARHSLHLLSASKTDQLTFERQQAIAEGFGYCTEGRNPASDMFMRDYYHHAAIMSRITNDVVSRMTASTQRTGLFGRLATQRFVRPGVTVTGDRLVIEEGSVDKDPLNLVHAFVDSQRLDVAFSPTTRETLRKNLDLLTPELCAGEEAVAALFEILRAPDGVYRTLANMNRLGVLGRLIPEFGRLFCMVQHDHYHVYTVDQHSLVGVRELERLRAGAYREASPFLTDIMRQCDQPELLFLAMMFHDLGKGYGGDHDERGAVMVRDIARRLFLNEDDCAALEYLVRNHLLMSTLAQKRDVSDPNLVLDLVTQVETPRNLLLLYLLTFADLKAVGPQVWSGWNDHLLAELYRSAAHLFAKGIVTEADLAERAERIKKRLAARATADLERTRMQEFLGTLPDSYFLSHEDDTIVDHWRLHESIGDALFRPGVVHYPERGFTEFTLCTRDRRGLFSRVTGVLTSHGLSVLSSRLTTSSAGWVIDVFRVEHSDRVGNGESSAGGADVDDGTVADDRTVTASDPVLWDSIKHDLDAVLGGSVEVEDLVSRWLDGRRPRIGDRAPVRGPYARVEIDNTASRDSTVIDVYASDRPGLLFTIANAIYELGLSVYAAVISTQATDVIDVFYVTDQNNGKIEDEGELARIREAIVTAIMGESAGAQTRPAVLG